MAKTSLNKRKLRKSSGEDRLSKLQDDLLCQILSNLSTKDSIRTSILSKRWRNLWSHVPALDLYQEHFEDDYDFLEFMDRFMESNKEPRLKRFRLVYNAFEHFHEDFVPRIDDVVKRGVCHLTFLNKLDYEEQLVRMPVSLYSCAILVNLTLYCVVMDSPEPELVCLPCVKTMHLEAVIFDGNWILEALISNCPVLEELTVVTHHADYLEDVSVRSQSLKTFKLESLRHECECVDPECEDPDVEIDAPRLEYMSISDYQPENLIIHSISSSAKVYIDVESDDPSMVSDFLTGVSTVREMIITARTLEVMNCCSELEPLPQFSNLSRLDASFVESSWELWPAFLGCCPKLHSLTLEFECLPKTEEMKLSYVPQCFRSSLEFVHLKMPIEITETKSKVNLGNYFMRNCALLKKLMLSESFGDVIKKIKRIPKMSRGCEVVMLEPPYEAVSRSFSLLPVIYNPCFN